MSASISRGDKFFEFLAHTGAVRCAVLGKRQPSIFCTGGDDGKVNVWKYMKAQPVISFPGHATTEVASVCFDYNEMNVFSASRGGSIKQWDLTTQKGVRSFPNTHRCSVDCLEPHPMNEFFASGSSDTFIKLWDLRKKESVITYKGHQSPVTKMAFSPDGRWLCSGDESGAAKIFDLGSGKCLQTLQTGDHAITAIQFHPSELVVAVGGASRCVEIWDLNADEFFVVATTDLEATKIRALTFHTGHLYPEDDDDLVTTTCRQSIMIATQDSLKSWSWEPKACLDAVDMQWDNVVDLAINANNQLLAISFQKSTVSNYLVELNQVSPFLEYNEKKDSRIVSLPPVDHPLSSTSPIHFGTTTEPSQIASIVEDFSKVMSPSWKAEIANKASSKHSDVADSLAGKLSGLNMNGARALRTQGENKIFLNEADYRNEIVSGSSSIQQILNIRLNRIRTLKSFWTSGRFDIFLTQILSLNDPSVTFDILSVCLSQMKKILTLDLAILMLPLARQLFEQTFRDGIIEQYSLLGIQIVQLVVESFAEVISETIVASHNPPAGVDVAREMRLSKCLSCVSEFKNMRPKVEALVPLGAPLGVQARVLNSLLSKLCSL